MRATLDFLVLQPQLDRRTGIRFQAKLLSRSLTARMAGASPPFQKSAAIKQAFSSAVTRLNASNRRHWMGRHGVTCSANRQYCRADYLSWHQIGHTWRSVQALSDRLLEYFWRSRRSGAEFLKGTEMTYNTLSMGSLELPSPICSRSAFRSHYM